MSDETHVHVPVTPTGMTFTNAFCVKCGYFPLPLEGSRPITPAERAQFYGAPAPTVDAAALTPLIHAYFNEWHTDANGEGPGCVHFDKGYGAYAQCEDPDEGVPIRALPAMFAALFARYGSRS